MTKNHLLLLLTTSIIGNCFTLYILNNFKQKAAIVFSNQELALKSGEDQLATTRDNFRQSLIWQLKYEGHSIDNDIRLIAPDESNYYLQNLIGSQPKLIYRITDKSCDVCYDKITEKLKKASDVFGRENIIVILPIKELRKTISAFKEQEIKAKIFAVTEELALGVPLESSTSPFFFILTNDFRVSSLFIPHKNGADITEEYLNEMSQKYFQK
jgi:hypothetical protein